MERSGGKASSELTDDQKEKLSEIEKKFEAQIAEKEILFNGQIQTLMAAGAHEEASALQDHLITEKQELIEKRERKKKKIREGKD
ncbi:MAG: hypothetical protein JKX97_01490 [Candidatus Lindowbacteria bacterium]|nr:hypothetical protein [Candidatus Lindowbacteria bacterium]